MTPPNKLLLVGIRGFVDEGGVAVTLATGCVSSSDNNPSRRLPPPVSPARDDVIDNKGSKVVSSLVLKSTRSSCD